MSNHIDWENEVSSYRKNKRVSALPSGVAEAKEAVSRAGASSLGRTLEEGGSEDEVDDDLDGIGANDNDDDVDAIDEVDEEGGDNVPPLPGRRAGGAAGGAGGNGVGHGGGVGGGIVDPDTLDDATWFGSWVEYREVNDSNSKLFFNSRTAEVCLNAKPTSRNDDNIKVAVGSGGGNIVDPQFHNPTRLRESFNQARRNSAILSETWDATQDGGKRPGGGGGNGKKDERRPAIIVRDSLDAIRQNVDVILNMSNSMAANVSEMLNNVKKTIADIQSGLQEAKESVVDDRTHVDYLIDWPRLKWDFHASKEADYYRASAMARTDHKAVQFQAWNLPGNR